MSELHGKKVFITGGTGFLGSHLLERLAKEGAELTALYRSEKKLEDFKAQDPALDKLEIQWIKGDLFTDWSLEGFDFIFHLAGFVGYSEEERAIMERVNVEGTAEVLKKIAAVHNKCKLIYSSSVVAVGAGENQQMVLDEESKYNMKSYDFGYFETKRKAEELVLEACNDGLHAVVLNPSTIYGPRDMVKGSRKFQLQMARGELSVCSKGGVSIVHVSDVCDAFIKATEYEKSGERFILAGDNITIYELLSEIARQAKVKKPRFVIPTWILISVGYVVHGLSFLGLKTSFKLENLKVATMYHWFKSHKAKKELGFQPRGHKEALIDSLGWAKEKGMF